MAARAEGDESGRDPGGDGTARIPLVGVAATAVGGGGEEEGAAHSGQLEAEGHALGGVGVGEEGEEGG